MGNLLTYLKENVFNEAVEYRDAVDLSLALYCSRDIFTDLPVEWCNMIDLSLAFAELSKVGMIIGYRDIDAAYYGAQNHSVTDKGHWIEVLSSITKKGTSYDYDRVQNLIKRTQKGKL